MDKEKVKLIIRNMELLLDSLKVELYSDAPSYKINDVVFSEEDFDGIEMYEEK